MAVAETVACPSSATLNPLAPFGRADPRVGDVVAAPLRRLFVAQWQLTRPAAQSSTTVRLRRPTAVRLRRYRDVQGRRRGSEGGAPACDAPPARHGGTQAATAPRLEQHAVLRCAALCCVQPASSLRHAIRPPGRPRVSCAPGGGRARSHRRCRRLCDPRAVAG